jgi:hypothetical protein
MSQGARSSAVVALLVIVAGLAIAACGSSSSSSSANASATTGGSLTTSTGTSTTGGPGGRAGGFFTSLTATQKACLKSHGVTLRTGGGKGFGGRGGTGTFTRPSGTPTGAPPTGAGGFGGGGFGGGASSKYATAFKDCDITVPTGGFHGRPGATGGAGGAKPTAAALKTFVACVDKHGYALKDSQLNTTGTGSILPKSLETNQQFLAAATPCEQDLFSGGRSGGAPGAGPGGAPGASGTTTTG